MGEFEDRMFQQSQANPLSGFITAGAAKLMTDRTVATGKTLDRLNESLKYLDGEPKPVYEQVEDLKADPEARKELQTIEEQSINYRAFQENIMKQKELYGNAYDDALAKLAIIGGEEANKLGQTLGTRKADMQAQYDAIKQLPDNQLRFASGILNYERTAAQHQEFVNNAELQSDIRNAIGDVQLNTQLADILPVGDVKLYSSSKYQKYVEEENKIVDYLRKQGYADDVAYGAISQMMKSRGGSVAYSDSIDRSAFYNAKRLNPVQKNTLQADRTTYSMYNAMYNDLSQELKDAVDAKDEGRTYNPFNPDDDPKQWQEYEDRVNAIYGIFGNNANIDKGTGKPYGGHMIQTYQRLLNSDAELQGYMGKGGTPTGTFWKNHDIPDGIGTDWSFLRHDGAKRLYEQRKLNIIEAEKLDGAGFEEGETNWWGGITEFEDTITRFLNKGRTEKEFEFEKTKRKFEDIDIKAKEAFNE